MIWHSSTSQEIADELGTDLGKGLESGKVAMLLSQYGKNVMNQTKKKSIIERFAAQMKDVMILILLLAAAVSVVLTVIEGTNDWAEPIVIVAIVILNAIIGVVQEYRAESALEALKVLAAPTAKVIRDGKTDTIDATELVPGDVILLDAGDFIPADARLFESYSMRCDESMLTGESVTAEKDAGVMCEDIASVGDRQNMVFSGCSVAYGSGKAVVTETGMTTEIGKIATILHGTEDAITPLQVKLASLGKSLGGIALAVCVVIFICGFFMKLGFMDMLMTSISLAVAAIPEGLPAIVTVVLAIGVQRMVKKNAIIRRLPAVETLGSASVICSDKTGTLTQNRMTLTRAYTDDIYEVDNLAPDSVRDLLKLGALCCDGTVEIDENGNEKHIGDPTETAIVAAAMHLHSTDKATLDSLYPRLCALPFDSERKLMSTVCMIDGKPFCIVKGGVDILVDRCEHADKEKITEANEAMAALALRVLAIAVKPLDEIPSNPTCEELEYGLTFVGLVGIIDPPRKEAKIAIGECKKAGIRTVMITGDHIITASAIAKKLGILEEGGLAVTGTELSAMSDDELDEKIEDICVYARVSPENKIQIVNAWQKKGEVVAMTGDGVNDAPALKAADIGCAMGITGTDVAKGAAAMTLTDDNFATIVTAVKEGRSIYNNIRKAVHFLLSCNLGEIIAVFFGLLIFKGVPLTPILLLWMNLVTDSLPALALGVEPVEKSIMDTPPRKKDESIFAHGLGINVLWQGAMFGILTLIAYNYGLTNHVGDHPQMYAQTIAFAVLSLSQLFHAMNCRSERSLFDVGWFKNKLMLGAFAVSVALMCLILFVPALAGVFGIASLAASDVLAIIGLSVIPLILSEIVKLVRFFIKK